MATSRGLSATLTNLTSSYSTLNINARLSLPTITPSSFLTLRSSPAGRLASAVERTLTVVIRASSGSSGQEDDQEEDEGFQAPRKAEVDMLLSAAMELDGNGNCTCHTGRPALNDLVKILAHESQFDIKFQTATPLPPLPGTGLCMLHAVAFLLGQALSNALRGSLESLLKKKSNYGFTAFIPSAQIQARVELASHPRFFCSSQSSEQGEQCYELQVMQNFLHSFMKGSGISILIDMDEQESTPKNVELAFKAFSSALGNATKKLVADLSMDNEAPRKAEVDMRLSAALNLDGSGNSDCETGLQFLDDLVNTLAHESQFNIAIRTTRPQPKEMFMVHSIGFLLGQALVNALGGSSESMLQDKLNSTITAYVPFAQLQARVELASGPSLSCSSWHFVREPEQYHDLQVMKSFLHSFVEGSGISICISTDEQEPTPKNVQIAFRAFSYALGRATKKQVDDLRMGREVFDSSTNLDDILGEN